MFNNLIPFELSGLVLNKLSLLIIPLVLTLVIELVIAFIFVFILKTKAVLLIVLFINLITNPFLNLILSLRTTPVNIYLFEGIVVLIEFLFLVFCLPRKNKLLLFLLSLIMNFCSFSSGKILLDLFAFRLY